MMLLGLEENEKEEGSCSAAIHHRYTTLPLAPPVGPPRRCTAPCAARPHAATVKPARDGDVHRHTHRTRHTRTDWGGTDKAQMSARAFNTACHEPRPPQYRPTDATYSRSDRPHTRFSVKQSRLFTRVVAPAGTSIHHCATASVSETPSLCALPSGQHLRALEAGRSRAAATATALRFSQYHCAPANLEPSRVQVSGSHLPILWPLGSPRCILCR